MELAMRLVTYRTPQQRPWPGDVVELGVDGIGRIRHPMVAA